jgi:hypothetical protein
MGSTFDRAVPHPVLACADSIEVALEIAAEAQVAFMDAKDKRTALLRLTRLDAKLAALRLRLMAASDDVAEAEGARDIAALITHHTCTDAGTNRRDLALAEALDRRWARVASAIGKGNVNVAQARVIVHALDELPTATVPADVLARAEAHLVAEAAHFGPPELRVLGRRILDIVAPQVGEEHEAEQLADEERNARRRTSLVTTRLGDGSTRITLQVPDGVATRLHTYLEAFTSAAAPRDRGGGPDPDRPEARSGVLLADGSGRPAEVASPRRGRHHAHRHRDARRLASGPRHWPAGAVGQADCCGGTSARVYRPGPAGRARWEVRGSRPGPLVAAVPTGTAQGDDHPGPRVPRRGMLDPGCLVRSPPLGESLGRRRPYRPEGRCPALLLASPSSARPDPRRQPDAQRGCAFQSADVTVRRQTGVVVRRARGRASRSARTGASA